MAVEMLRTGFTQRVRPFRDRPDLEVNLVWYPALPTAKALPFATAMNSNLFNGDWWSREGPGPVGYVGTPNWEGKKIGAHGQYPCMSPEEAADGWLYDPDADCTRRIDGLLECCGLIIVPHGGGRVGGGGRAIIPHGGGRASGRQVLWQHLGGGLASGRQALWQHLGGGLASGRQALGQHFGGGLASGFADLEPEPFCEQIQGATTCAGSTVIFPFVGEHCLLTRPSGESWWRYALDSGGSFTVELLDPIPPGLEMTLYTGVCLSRTERAVLNDSNRTASVSVAAFDFFFFLVPDQGGPVQIWLEIS